jgi:hypothetical protein
MQRSRRSRMGTRHQQEKEEGNHGPHTHLIGKSRRGLKGTSGHVGRSETSLHPLL